MLAQFHNDRGKCKETLQHRNYCPPAYMDYEDEDGNIILGGWRAEEDETGLQNIGRLGAIKCQLEQPLNSGIQILCNYFVSKAGEEAAPWQYERALRGRIINFPVSQ